MKTKQTNFFFNTLLILLLGFVTYHYRVELSFAWDKFFNKLQPCQKPISYSIANLDPNFSLSKEDLLADIKKAEEIWENSGHKNLFEYSDSGDLKINLIYDSRQKATDGLKKIGLVINNDRASYDTLKTKYDSLIISYNQEKSRLDSLVATYDEDKKSYDKEVSRSNSHGGASKEEFEALEKRRLSLNNQVATINQASDSLNALVDTINSVEEVLNKLINTLNLQIDSYNTLGVSNGQQFNEGEYISKAGVSTINIYQFNNNNELIAVLAHELGHALGMEHVDDTKAIMYYLNEGGSENLTASDVGELNRVCKIK